MAIDKRKIIRGRDPNNKKTIRIEKQIEEFLEKEEYLSEYYDKVKPLEYYRDMFPENSFEMGVLFHYARKAEIPLDEALKDAMELLPWLDSLTNREGNDFTEADILAATHYYNDEFIKMGRKAKS